MKEKIPKAQSKAGKTGFLDTVLIMLIQESIFTTVYFYKNVLAFIESHCEACKISVSLPMNMLKGFKVQTF